MAMFETASHSIEDASLSPRPHTEPAKASENYSLLMMASRHHHVSPPASLDEEVSSTPYFIASCLGYIWLTVALIGILWGASFVWYRDGASKVVAMLLWTDSLNPLFLALAVGPAVALILFGAWKHRHGQLRSATASKGKVVLK